MGIFVHHGQERGATGWSHLYMDVVIALNVDLTRPTQCEMFLGKKGKRSLFTVDALGVDIAAFSAHQEVSSGIRARCCKPGNAIAQDVCLHYLGE